MSTTKQDNDTVVGNNPEDVPEITVTTDEALEFMLQVGTDRFNEQVSNGQVNPIELAKALGIRPQMIYNYVRNGKLEATQSTTQKVQISVQVATEFAAKYLSRKATKQAKVDAELAGE
jgi:hypothetical protein